MQTQLIAITRADGSLVILHFVLGQERAATPDNVAAEIVRAGIPDVARWRCIEPEDLPASREHRNRWIDNGTAIVVAKGAP